MGTDNADPFGAVHRAAAANGDNHVTALLGIDFGTAHHLLNPWVGGYLGETNTADTLFKQQRLDFSHPARLFNAGVRHQQYLACAKGNRVVGNGLASTTAKNNLG